MYCGATNVHNHSPLFGETNSERASVDIWTSVDMYCAANNVHNHSPDLSAISSSEPTLLHGNNKSEVVEAERTEESSSRPITGGRSGDDSEALAGAERNERNAGTWRGFQSGDMSGSYEGRANEGRDTAGQLEGKGDCHSQPHGWVSGAFDELVAIFPHRRAVVSKLNLLRNREDAIVSRYNQ